MEERDFNPPENIGAIALEFEAMQETGTVCFLEKETFMNLISYYETDDVAQALIVTEFALEQYPFSEEFFLQKAQLLIQINKSEEALAWLSDALTYGTDEIELAIIRAEAFLRLEKYADAHASLRAVPLKNCSREDLSDLYYCEGLIYEDQEKFQYMFHALRRALLLNPRNEAALERIWLCTELTQKYDASIRLHLELIDEAPYSYLAWYNLGNAYACLGDWEKAIESFEFTIAINEKFDFAYRDAIAACLEAGRYAHALDLFNDLRTFQQPDSEILLQVGECYERERVTEKAIELYQEAIDLNPEDPEIHFRLGSLYASLEQWELALFSLEKAVNLEKRREEFLVALAEACYQLGQLERAGNLFQQATEAAPEQSIIWIQYAAFLIAVNEYEVARDIASEGAWYVPSPELDYLKAACLFLLGKKKEGKVVLLEALSENYDLHELIFEIAPQLENNRHVMALIASYKV